MSRRRVVLLACLACMTVLATSCVATPKRATTSLPATMPMGTPTMAPTTSSTTTTPTVAVIASVPPDPRVGAVFSGDRSLHDCSGAVLDSPKGNLVLTAAHCMVDGVEAYFVPGFADDAEPSDYWRIDAVYLDPRWLTKRDPLADFAVARVEHDGGDSLESRVGGLTLGHEPTSGAEITVDGYAGGVGGQQLGCRAQATTQRGYPALPCVGLVDGTSGAPWLSGSVITGLVGGLDGGGCEENVSYSPPFDDAVHELLRRAEAGGPGDAAPGDYISDC